MITGVVESHGKGCRPITESKGILNFTEIFPFTDFLVEISGKALLPFESLRVRLLFSYAVWS